MSPTIDAPVARPRVEGDRELEVLEATREVLADVGYDRLTMDAVATRARASKATLYRRWNDKVSLVIDALLAVKGSSEVADTGSLRNDLISCYCGIGGLTDRQSLSTFASIITAISRDEDFAAAFRDRVVGPRSKVTHAIFERARDRGEIPADVDLDLLAPALAGIVLHRTYLLGEVPDRALVTRVIDQIILPAATRSTAPAPITEGNDHV